MSFVNPDCRDGKHDPVCSGTAWDLNNDELISCSCACHEVNEGLEMTEETTNPNQALFDVVEKHVKTVKLDALMHKSGQPVIIGEAVVTKHGDHFEIYIKATLPEAQQMGELLTSGLVSSVSIGGVIDKEVASRVFNRLN